MIWRAPNMVSSAPSGQMAAMDSIPKACRCRCGKSGQRRLRIRQARKQPHAPCGRGSVASGLLPVGRGPRRLHAKLPCNRRLRFSPTAPHWARPSGAPLNVDAALRAAGKRPVRVRGAAVLADAATVAAGRIHNGPPRRVGRERLVGARIHAHAATSRNPSDAALRVDDRKHHKGMAYYPLRHYHGVSIFLEVHAAQKSLDEMFHGFSIDLKPYYDKTQMEKIRAIHEQITSNLQVRVTIEELSKQYDMPATSMKKCFREIYGDSIYSYQKRYRMNVAANLLMEDSKVEIQEIALKMGYENPGKFSSAFKSVMGVTPAKYRKH